MGIASLAATALWSIVCIFVAYVRFEKMDF